MYQVFAVKQTEGQVLVTLVSDIEDVAGFCDAAGDTAGTAHLSSAVWVAAPDLRIFEEKKQGARGWCGAPCLA
ncbi:hypothetical protein [Alloyangia pacifica]|uniref:hypothetical protein n=1 Tax=Alloyangia pacifica TaxID=311180 RepID=UPI001CD71101|nr:hypothetical protein [Alloyangia pacifica]MCA0996857.1 hypothetical protein [Alloyangia pacifica]